MAEYEQVKSVDPSKTNFAPEPNSVLASGTSSPEKLTTRLTLEELPSREEFFSELSHNRAFNRTLSGFLLRCQESSERANYPTPKATAWQFPDGPLSISDSAKVRATVIH
jgi:hypothetical protein